MVFVRILSCMFQFDSFSETQHVVSSLVSCRDLVLASACPELQKRMQLREVKIDSYLSFCLAHRSQGLHVIFEFSLVRFSHTP